MAAVLYADTSARSTGISRTVAGAHLAPHEEHRGSPRQEPPHHDRGERVSGPADDRRPAAEGAQRRFGHLLGALHARSEARGPTGRGAPFVSGGRRGPRAAGENVDAPSAELVP